MSKPRYRRRRNIALGAGFVFSIALLLVQLVGSWRLDTAKSSRLADKGLVSWITTEGARPVILSIAGGVGASLLAASLFLIAIQTVLDRENARENADDRMRERISYLVGRMRLNRDFAVGAVSDLRSSGALSSGALGNAVLANADLDALDLSGASLEGAILTSANLRDVRFIGARLNGASLTGANITGADLSFAQLEGSDLSDEQLRSSDSLWQAILPNGSRYDGRWRLAGEMKMLASYGYDAQNEDEIANFFCAL